MSLAWGDIKQLVRLQAVSEEFAVIAQRGEESGEWHAVGRGFSGVLEALMDGVHRTLSGADPGLAEEFEQIVIDTTSERLSLSARAAILAGWLKGAVEAETLEVRIRVGEDRVRGGKVASRVPVG